MLRLPGHGNNVTAKQPRQLLSQRGTGVGSRVAKEKKKSGSVLRWCGRALIDVAELVWRHGPELRAAMQGKLDAQPSAAEELDLEQTRRERDQQQLLAEEARRQKEEAHAEALRAKEAHRKLRGALRSG